MLSGKIPFNFFQTTASRMRYNKNQMKKKKNENQRKKLQSVYRGETGNHRIQECEWINKQNERDYFKLLPYSHILFGKCEKEQEIPKTPKETNAHFKNCTA